MSIKWGATWPFRGVSEACTGAHIGACCQIQPARSMFAQPAVWYLHRSYRNPRRSVYLERENQQKSLVWFMESGSVLWPRSKNTVRRTLVKRHLWAPEPASYSYHSRHGNGRLGRLIPLFFHPLIGPSHEARHHWETHSGPAVKTTRRPVPVGHDLSGSFKHWWVNKKQQVTSKGSSYWVIY